MNLLAVFLENKPGQTARVSRILSEQGINICWVTVASSTTFGVMKLLVDRVEQAERSLQAAGFMVSPLQALAVEVPNQPGALHAVADTLSQHQVNLDNCSGFISGDKAILVIETQERDKARTLLASRGWRVLSQDDLSAPA